MTISSNEKICAYLDHHWSRKCWFLCVQMNWVCPTEAQRFCENDSDSCHWLCLKSLCGKRDSGRFESAFFLTWLESFPSRQKLWLESRCYWFQPVLCPLCFGQENEKMHKCVTFLKITDPRDCWYLWKNSN